MASGVRCGRSLVRGALRRGIFDASPSKILLAQQRVCQETQGEAQTNLQPPTMRWDRAFASSSAASSSEFHLCGDSAFARQFHSTAAALVAPDYQIERDGDAALQHVLQCEIEDLTKQSRNIPARGPPSPFKLVKDEPGELEITLTRVYGLEDIQLSCVLQLIPEKYRRKAKIGEDPQARTKMLQLTITVTKGCASPAFNLKCECYKDCFAIHQADLEIAPDDTVYRPYFSELKPDIVNNFQIFLYDRGLNADLALYMETHLESKRLLKSIRAVESIRNFL